MSKTTEDRVCAILIAYLKKQNKPVKIMDLTSFLLSPQDVCKFDAELKKDEIVALLNSFKSRKKSENVLQFLCSQKKLCEFCCSLETVEAKDFYKHAYVQLNSSLTRKNSKSGTIQEENNFLCEEKIICNGNGVFTTRRAQFVKNTVDVKVCTVLTTYLKQKRSVKIADLYSFLLSTQDVSKIDGNLKKRDIVTLLNCYKTIEKPVGFSLLNFVKSHKELFEVHCITKATSARKIYNTNAYVKSKVAPTNSFEGNCVLYGQEEEMFNCSEEFGGKSTDSQSSSSKVSKEANVKKGSKGVKNGKVNPLGCIVDKEVEAKVCLVIAEYLAQLKKDVKAMDIYSFLLSPVAVSRFDSGLRKAEVITLLNCYNKTSESPFSSILNFLESHGDLFEVYSGTQRRPERAYVKVKVSSSSGECKERELEDSDGSSNCTAEESLTQNKTKDGQLQNMEFEKKAVEASVCAVIAAYLKKLNKAVKVADLYSFLLSPEATSKFDAPLKKTDIAAVLGQYNNPMSKASNVPHFMTLLNFVCAHNDLFCVEDKKVLSGEVMAFVTLKSTKAEVKSLSEEWSKKSTCCAKSSQSKNSKIKQFTQSKDSKFEPAVLKRQPPTEEETRSFLSTMKSGPNYVEDDDVVIGGPVTIHQWMASRKSYFSMHKKNLCKRRRKILAV